MLGTAVACLDIMAVAIRALPPGIPPGSSASELAVLKYRVMIWEKLQENKAGNTFNYTKSLHKKKVFLIAFLSACKSANSKV